MHTTPSVKTALKICNTNEDETLSGHKSFAISPPQTPPPPPPSSAEGSHIDKSYNRQLESTPHKALHDPPGAVDQTPAGTEGANQHHLGPNLQLHNAPGLYKQPFLDKLTNQK